jgi:hypothetical protein
MSVKALLFPYPIFVHIQEAGAVFLRACLVRWMGRNEMSFYFLWCLIRRRYSTLRMSVKESRINLSKKFMDQPILHHSYHYNNL